MAVLIRISSFRPAAPPPGPPPPPLLSSSKACPRRRAVAATIEICKPDDFEVGRVLGTCGYMNVISCTPPPQMGTLSSREPLGLDQWDLQRKMISQEVRDGGVQVRLYTGPRKGTRGVLKATRCFAASGSYPGATEEGGSLTPDFQTAFPRRVAQFQDAFWRFLRPHTIRGTIIGTTAVVVRALIDNSHLIDWGLLPKALRGLLALLCGNGYIVGINQIYDIGIDKVNKPFLPVAAGDLSVPAAWALVVSFALLGIIIVATNFGPLITSLYSFGLFLGAIYSVPPLRLKRFAVAAFLIIATVRGFLLNFGVYYATRASLGLAYAWSPHILFITIFVTVFATVIAITKDLADVEGDRKFQISTFATKLGVRNITFLGSGLLLFNYLGAVVSACIFPEVFRKSIMLGGHSLLAAGLIYQTWLLDSSKYSKEAVAGYYRFIWNLFYAEYAMFPFI